MYIRSLAMPAFCLALTACVSGGGTNSAPVGPGFYRYSDEGAVFSIPPKGNTYCLVVSVSMMEALGGFTQVHVVDHGVDFKGNRVWTEQCPWPPGRYRNVGSNVVYTVSQSHTVCREVSHPGHSIDKPARLISSDSNVLLKSKYTGLCHA